MGFLTVGNMYEKISENSNEYIVYTDGGCISNPGGAGGFGIVILNGNKEETLSKGYLSSTNNRMELRAPIEALKHIPKGSIVYMYTDSQYFCNPMNKGWLENWLKTDWKKGTVKNIDLWKQWIEVSKDYTIDITWVKGHNNNKYNEVCDKLATAAYKDVENLIEDEGYCPE